MNYSGHKNTRIKVTRRERPENKEWMLFWPGLGYTIRNKYFAELLDELHVTYNLLVPDLRAHGASEGQFSFEDLCEDIVLITKKLEQEHPGIVVAGHSVAATAIATVAHELPDTPLVLFAPVMRLRHRIPKPIQALVLHTPTAMGNALIKLTLAGINLKTLNVRATGLRNLGSYWGECYLGENLRQFWDEGMRFDVTLPRMQQNGIILYGEKDKLIHDLEHYRSAVSSTTLNPVVLTELGHHFKAFTRERARQQSILVANAIKNAMHVLQPIPIQPRVVAQQTNQ